MSADGLPLVTLVILDGWGIAPPGPGNAVELARTPVFDDLVARYPTTQLRASGPAVGLPEGQMGNSEVGHLTIGSGRILFQDLVRVSRAVEDGSLFENEALLGAFRRAKERDGDVHLLGLVSTGGVHSHIDHLRALLEIGERAGLGDRTWVHAFTDGRDVSPHAAVDDLATLPAERIATVVGRYYAMDRDKRWERTDRALDAIVGGVGEEADDPVAAVRASYERGVTDEFVEPIVLRGRPRLDPAKDAAIVFNFRPDRVRQLTQRLLEAGADVVTMTRYSDDFDCPVAFGEQDVPDTLAEVAERRRPAAAPRGGDREVRARDVLLRRRRRGAVDGEERILVPSPRDVAELRPEAGDVRARGRRAGRRRARRRLRLLRRQLREPRHGRSHGRDPGGRRGGRDGRRVPRPRSSRRRTARAASASSPPTTGTRRRCSRTTASARTRRTRRTRCRSSSPWRAPRSATEASSPTLRRPCSTCSGSSRPAAMTGASLVAPGRSLTRHRVVNCS